jgi:hypothetical protein
MTTLNVFFVPADLSITWQRGDRAEIPPYVLEKLTSPVIKET